MSTLRISLLGTPQIYLGDTPLLFKTRKGLALLVYLLLERGLHTREQLMELFWPGKDEEQARGSLRQTLARVRDVLDEGYLMVSREQLGFNFNSMYQLDLNAFKTSGSVESLEGALALYRGEFLQGFELDDAPEFGDWVLTQREYFRERLELILDQLLQHYQQAGKTSDALETASRWIKLDPLSQTAHQRLIELHLARHNPSAASKALGNARQVFARENLELPPELMSLSQRLQNGSKPRVQVMVEAPPKLAAALPTIPAGRAKEWAQLEAAWQERKSIFISGAAGVGKTHLARAFASTKGRFHETQGRPGDVSVPYSAITRLIRDTIKLYPLELKPWELQEMSRILPELSDQLPGPLRSPEEQYRFFQAFVGFARQLSRFMAIGVTDDIHWWDAPSSALGAYVNSHVPNQASGIAPSINIFRTGHMSAEVLVHLENTVQSGSSVWIDLEPLDASGVGEMLEQLVPEAKGRLEPLVEPMQQFTGGNPLFIRETVQALLEQGGPEALTSQGLEHLRREGGLSRLPKVGAVIQGRFAQLSGEAQDVVRIAAIAGQEFSLKIAESVSQLGKLRLAHVIEELQGHRVFRDLLFDHDLLYEAALDYIPAPSKVLLHQAVLEALEGERVPAAARLRHAEAADLPDAVLRHSLEAAEEALRLYVLPEAKAHCARALDLLETQPDSGLLRSRALEGLADIAELEGQLEEARIGFEEALTVLEGHQPVLESRLLRKTANVLRLQRRFDEAQAARERAEAALGRGEDAAWWREWLQIQLEHAGQWYFQGRTGELGALLGRIQPAVELHANLGQKARYYQQQAMLGLRQSRYAADLPTLEHARKALEAIGQVGSPSEIGGMQFDYGFCLLWNARFDQAEENLLAAQRIAEQIQHKVLLSRCLTYLTVLWRKRGEVEQTRALALRSLEVAQQGQMVEYQGTAKANLAWVALTEGQFDQAAELGLDALELWSKVPLGHASLSFQWTALWPLIAVECQRNCLDKAITYAEALFQPAQQKMPEALEQRLEQTIGAFRVKDLPLVREGLRVTLQDARQQLYL